MLAIIKLCKQDISPKASSPSSYGILWLDHPQHYLLALEHSQRTALQCPEKFIKDELFGNLYIPSTAK